MVVPRLSCPNSSDSGSLLIPPKSCRTSSAFASRAASCKEPGAKVSGCCWALFALSCLGALGAAEEEGEEEVDEDEDKEEEEEEAEKEDEGDTRTMACDEGGDDDEEDE